MPHLPLLTSISFIPHVGSSSGLPDHTLLTTWNQSCCGQQAHYFLFPYPYFRLAGLAAGDDRGIFKGISCRNFSGPWLKAEGNKMSYLYCHLLIVDKLKLKLQRYKRCYNTIPKTFNWWCRVVNFCYFYFGCMMPRFFCWFDNAMFTFTFSFLLTGKQFSNLQKKPEKKRKGSRKVIVLNPIR